MPIETTLPPVQVNVVPVSDTQIIAQPPLALAYRNNQVIQVQLFGNLVYGGAGIELNMNPPAPHDPWPENAVVTLISATLAQINIGTPIPPEEDSQLYEYFILYRTTADLPDSELRRSRPVSITDLQADPTGLTKHDPDTGNQNQP